MSSPSITSLLLVLLMTVIPILLYRLYIRLFRRPFPDGAPRVVAEGSAFLGATRFFEARWDFFKEWAARSSGSFSFYVGTKRVIGLTGEAGRKWFLDSGDLQFNQGYGLLFGENSDMLDGHRSFEKYFPLHLMQILNRKALVKVLPYLVDDTLTHLEALAHSQKPINPFESMYRLVFQMTARTVGCYELADDPDLTVKLLPNVRLMHEAASPMFVLFPWIPIPSTIRRHYAGFQIYRAIRRIIKGRQMAPTGQEDALQCLVDKGNSTVTTVRVIVGSLMVGLLNSTTNAAWVLIYLGMHPEWLGRVRQEVIAAIDKCIPNKDISILDRLCQLSYRDWESQFPVLDLCLKETIRIQTPGCILRKNTSDRTLKFQNKVIPAGSFVAYHLRDIHHDPDVYSDPDEWDPELHLSHKAKYKNKAYGYIGWGAGKYPCLGMRFAKLENAIITAFFITVFDFEVTDEEGEQLENLPEIDVNRSSAWPPSKPPHLKCRIRDVAVA